MKKTHIWSILVHEFVKEGMYTIRAFNTQTTPEISSKLIKIFGPNLFNNILTRTRGNLNI